MFPIQTKNETIFNALSLTSSQTSSVINIRESIGYAVHFYWSGGTLTAGSLVVEGTNDNLDEPSTSATYSTISTTAVTTTSGDLLINVERAMYSYIRLKWVRTAGTGGTITAKISIKRY